MKILKQLAIIMMICLLAQGISILLPFAFPNSVIAILLVGGLLLGGVLKEKQIKETADFLMPNMAVVFVPLSVQMLQDFKVIRSNLAAFLIVVVISLIITFLGTYYAVVLIQKLLKRWRKRRMRHAGNLE